MTGWSQGQWFSLGLPFLYPCKKKQNKRPNMLPSVGQKLFQSKVLVWGLMEGRRVEHSHRCGGMRY